LGSIHGGRFVHKLGAKGDYAADSRISSPREEFLTPSVRSTSIAFSAARH